MRNCFKVSEYIKKNFGVMLEEAARRFISGAKGVFRGGYDGDLQFPPVRGYRILSVNAATCTYSPTAVRFYVEACIAFPDGHGENAVKLIEICEGDAEKEFADMRMESVCAWDGHLEPEKEEGTFWLDGNLVPVISHEDYPACADIILSRYMPAALRGACPADGRELASRLGLTVEERPISADMDVLGRIYMDDTDDVLYDRDTGRKAVKHIKRDTVIVDREAAERRSPYSCNVTYIHECVHSYFHRISYMFRKMTEHDSAVYQYTGAAGKGDFIEIQACGITPYIMMPQGSLNRRLAGLRGAARMDTSRDAGCWERTLRDLSLYYSVPLSVARKRLMGEGFPVEGICRYEDGHRVRPYLYSRGALGKGETFTVSRERQGEKGEAPVRGDYVFAENHMCLDEGKYVTQGPGEIMLTDYALGHMDECCMKFTRPPYGRESGDRSGTARMDRKTASSGGAEFSKRLSCCVDAYRPGSSLFFDPSLRRTADEAVRELISAISGTGAAKTIDVIFRKMGLSNTKVEADLGIGDGNFSKFRSGASKISKRYLIAFCLSCRFVPEITLTVMNCCGYTFNIADDEDMHYKAIVTYRWYEGDIEEINECLISYGVAPLTPARAAAPRVSRPA